MYSVASFNQGLSSWIGRLPHVWVEGEVTELRRQAGWAFVFWTLKDLEGGAAVKVRMPRTQYDRVEPPLQDGDRVHVHGRPELFTRTGELSLRVHAVARLGLGDLLARLERLKTALAAEGLFAAERKQLLPRFPRPHRTRLRHVTPRPSTTSWRTRGGGFPRRGSRSWSAPYRARLHHASWCAPSAGSTATTRST